MRGESTFRLSPMNAVDLRLITNGSRANVLLVGPDSATLEALAEIEDSLRPPIFCWPRDGAPWDAHDEPRTVVLHDLASLNLSNQELLLAWLKRAGRETQLISRSREPIHPLVVRRRFSEGLYYYLNVLYIDCL